MSETFFEKNRLTPEEAESEAARIQELVGDKSSSEDYNLAQKMVEEENTKDPKAWFEQLKKGRITILPPRMDKGIMIALDTKDPVIKKSFDAAAAKVTKQYRGFHQNGSTETIGYSAWELWDPRDSSPVEIVDLIYKEMMTNYEFWKSYYEEKR